MPLRDETVWQISTFFYLCRMAIKLQYQLSSFELLIWELTEPLPFYVEQLQLSPTQLEQLEQNFTNPVALLEWLASRYCLQLLLERAYTDFKKNEHGKLELVDQSWKLSISHSNQRIAVVKSKLDIGIDIQVLSPKLQRIASKYIAPKLLAELRDSPQYIDYLHIYWGIKEALFKAYGLGQVNFIKHLHISPFVFEQKGVTKAKITKENFEADYEVFYEKKEDYYLCIVTKI